MLSFNCSCVGFFTCVKHQENFKSLMIFWCVLEVWLEYVFIACVFKQWINAILLVVFYCLLHIQLLANMGMGDCNPVVRKLLGTKQPWLKGFTYLAFNSSFWLLTGAWVGSESHKQLHTWGSPFSLLSSVCAEAGGLPPLDLVLWTSPLLVPSSFWLPLLPLPATCGPQKIKGSLVVTLTVMKTATN